MAWAKRSARIVAWGLIAASTVVLLLALASLIGISWTAASGEGARLRSSRLDIVYRAPGTLMKSYSKGWTVGRSRDPRAEISGGAGWMSTQNRDWWFCSATIVSGGPLPPGAGGSVMAVVVQTRLWRISIATALAGAALFVASKKRRQPGVCPSCGYNLSGLGSDAPCPECGAGSGAAAAAVSARPTP